MPILRFDRQPMTIGKTHPFMKPAFPKAVLAFALAVQSHGAVINLKAGGDAVNTTSFNSALNWDPAVAPSAGNTYAVSVEFLRTPGDANNYTFGGDSLTLNVGGGMIYKGTAATNTYTISNLILNGGYVRSGAGSGNTLILAGGLAISGTGSRFLADQSPFIINSVTSGTGELATLSAAPGFPITFTAANTYTGNLTVSTIQNGASTILSDTSRWKFAVGANGVNNTITGNGKLTLNGVFDLDLSGAANSVGNHWTLVDVTNLTETFGNTFSIAGFTENNNIWTDSSGRYQFLESTGVLSVINSDTDQDGLSDAWEMAHFHSLDLTGTDDPDADGVDNETEETAGTDPNSDTSWPDADSDGLQDAWEVRFFGNITAQNALGDADGDLVSNLLEFQQRTSPTDPSAWADTDFDGLNDAWEMLFFGDLSKDGLADNDHDSFTDYEEHEAHTDPTKPALSPLGVVLRNRWSFNGNLTDSVGGKTASIVEVGVNNVAYNDTVNPTAITLAGGASNASDYVQLGSHLLPKGVTPVTIELWARQNTIQNWSRIFDFNNGTAEYLMMSWTRGGADATDNSEIVDGGIVSNALDKNQPYGVTDEFHIMMVLQPLAGSGGRMKVTFYSAKSSATDLGPARGSFETAVNLVNFNDLVNNLGYSPFTGDSTASATYNEVRIWDGAPPISVREKLHDLGPDNVAMPDSDGDFLPDAWELTWFPNLTSAGIRISNVLTGGSNDDNDADGINNRDEYLAGSNPSSAVSGPDDTDADGLTDAWEITWFGNITAQTGSGDADGDHLTNLQEMESGTSPTNPDDDGDGLSDGWERTYFSGLTQTGTDDPDGDGFTNEQEETGFSDPSLATSIPGDVDRDGLADTWEITWFTNLPAQNGTGDPDGDGYTNEQEETGGSNPNDITSIPGDINGDGITPDGILLTTGDPLGASSFNTGTGWSNALPPVAGTNYMVNLQGLRTPADALAYAFAGDRLILTTGGSLIVKGTGVLTFPDLGLDGGFVNNATNANAVITLEGAIRVTRQSNLWANNNSIIVNAVISGTKTLDLTRSGTTNTVTLNAVNTLTGNLNVTGGLILGPTGSLVFKTAAGGLSNSVLGTGTATFNGTFDIDLAGASGTAGATWTLVNAATLVETYGTTFAVKGFTADAAAAGARKWTSGGYQFDEATGVLTLLGGTGDGDADGMVDSWETTWFGGLGQAASGDFDGDGTSNLVEYRLGLIPNSGNSRFTATRGSTGVLTWPSAIGVTFVVQRNSTLTAGGWTSIATISGTAGTASYTDPAPPAGQAFYRIQLVP